MPTHFNARLRACCCFLLIPLAAPQLAQAAGGHHSVDDADILPAGACEQENWASRAQGGARLLHVGAACRLGPVQLGAAAEYARHQGASATAWGLEVKWAHAVTDSLSLGLVAQPVWQAHLRPRYQGVSAVALASWRPRENLAFHANAGRDFVNGGDDEKRGGVAAEWMAAQDWWLTVERYREQATHFTRAGVRWLAAKNWSVDVSRAHRLAGPAPSNWTIGLSFTFGGD
ncbi:MAG TPA: hypothetical protein VLK85_19205 [Ramlibacter sp.]|nr:hypothetical protein [Ramlibacter sp.]